MEIHNIVRKYIDKVIIPKYGELHYKVSGISTVDIKYSELPKDEVNNIIEDTKLLLTMLGLKNVNAVPIVAKKYTYVTGEK